MTNTKTKTSALERAAQLTEVRAAALLIAAGVAGEVEAEAAALVAALEARTAAEERMYLVCSEQGVAIGDLFTQGVEKRYTSAQLSAARDASVEFKRASSAADGTKIVLNRAVGEVMAGDEVRGHVAALAHDMLVRLDDAASTLRDVGSALASLDSILRESPVLRESAGRWKPANAAMFTRTDPVAPLRQDAERMMRIADAP